MINWITLKFNDANKEIEYNEAKLNEIIQTIKKILVLCFVFASIELIKEIILYALKKIPFTSFYYYFGLLVIFLFILIVSYKFTNRITIMIPILLAILCIFFCFNYFYIGMIEFTHFMVIINIIYMLRGKNIVIYL